MNKIRLLFVLVYSSPDDRQCLQLASSWNIPGQPGALQALQHAITRGGYRGHQTYIQVVLTWDSSEGHLLAFLWPEDSLGHILHRWNFHQNFLDALHGRTTLPRVFPSDETCYFLGRSHAFQALVAVEPGSLFA